MTATLDLRYEAKWWVLLPNSFPTGEDRSVEEWAARVAMQYPSQQAWNEPPLAGSLAQFLQQQFLAISPQRTAALWFCPSGLPADGYVQVTLTPDPNAQDVTFNEIVKGLTSQLDFRVENVETHNLGAGIAFARMRAGRIEGDRTLPDYGETTYLFRPAGYLLFIVARSADPRMVGLMSESLWDIVESITIND